MQHTPLDDKDNVELQPGISSPATPAATPPQSNEQAEPQSLFYTQDQEEETPDLHLPAPDAQAEHSSPFVVPFQRSAAMPTLTDNPTHRAQAPASSPPTPPTGKAGRNSFRLLRLLLIAGVVLVTVVGASLFVFAQPATPPTAPREQAHQSSPEPVARPTQKPSPNIPKPASPQAKPRPTAAPAPPAQKKTEPPEQHTQNPGSQTPENESALEWKLPSVEQLQKLGWTRANLSQADGVEALRTAMAFTDREMSYDYRTIGTTTHHGGTLTSATFLLTPGAKVRFTQSDVRVINNTLFEKIRTTRLIQQVIGGHPALVQFQSVQIQGKLQRIAWVRVAFSLLESRYDTATGKRMERREQNPKTGRPIIHQMTVVLLRVAPQTQGANAPMGGTGWLVNTYELDAPTLPALATAPTL